MQQATTTHVYGPVTLAGLQDAVVNDRIHTLTEGELLSLVLSDTVGIDIVDHFGGLKGICNQPLEKFLSFPGLHDAKITRIAACFEMARRVVHQIIEIRERR